MSNTSQRFENDTPYTDGHIFIPGEEFKQVSGAAQTFTRNAKGDLSINQGASIAAVYTRSISHLFRLGLGQLLQEQFGGSVGPDAVPGFPGSPVATFANATAAQLVPPSTNKIPKGINILDITPQYRIDTNPLSVHTIGISKTVYANNAALTIIDILAQAANGLATAVQASPYSTKIAVNSGFVIDDLSQLVIEWTVTTPVGGAFRLYGIDVHVSFNYN